MSSRFDAERVKEFAAESGVVLTPEQVRALDVLARGGTVIRARRGGWTTLQQLIRDSHDAQDGQP